MSKKRIRGYRLLMLLGFVLVAITWTNYAFSDPGASNITSLSEPTPGCGPESTPDNELEPTPGCGPEPTPDPEPEPTPDPEPEPTPDPEPEPTPDPSSDDSADHEVTDEGTIHVLSGTFDGGGESYTNPNEKNDGSQDENQPAVFELEPGTNLINCRIVPPAGDGIHVHGDNTVENVIFEDVGEDAISMRSNFEGGTVTIRNCSFSNADDKVLQVNRESTWYLYDITVNTAGKVMRQNGGKTFKLDVYIDGLKAYDINEALVKSDSPSCTVYYKNITTDLPSDKWWKGELNAVPW